MTALLCGHVFHDECLHTYKDAKGVQEIAKLKCPTCRFSSRPLDGSSDCDSPLPPMDDDVVVSSNEEIIVEIPSGSNSNATYVAKGSGKGHSVDRPLASPPPRVNRDAEHPDFRSEADATCATSPGGEEPSDGHEEDVADDLPQVPTAKSRAKARAKAGIVISSDVGGANGVAEPEAKAKAKGKSKASGKAKAKAKADAKSSAPALAKAKATAAAASASDLEADLAEAEPQPKAKGKAAGKSGRANAKAAPGEGGVEDGGEDARSQPEAERHAAGKGSGKSKAKSAKAQSAAPFKAASKAQAKAPAVTEVEVRAPRTRRLHCLRGVRGWPAGKASCRLRGSLRFNKIQLLSCLRGLGAPTQAYAFALALARAKQTHLCNTGAEVRSTEPRGSSEVPRLQNKPCPAAARYVGSAFPQGCRWGGCCEYRGGTRRCRVSGCRRRP